MSPSQTTDPPADPDDESSDDNVTEEMSDYKQIQLNEHWIQRLCEDDKHRIHRVTRIVSELKDSKLQWNTLRKWFNKACVIESGLENLTGRKKTSDKEVIHLFIAG